MTTVSEGERELPPLPEPIGWEYSFRNQKHLAVHRVAGIRSQGVFSLEQVEEIRSQVWQAATQRERERQWFSVERDGMPPCDGETVFVGINSAGFSCCFNDARPDGLCLMGSTECSTAQMSELRWWRVLDRPAAIRKESKGEDQPAGGGNG